MSVNASDVVRAAVLKGFSPVGIIPPGVHLVDTTVTLRVTGTVKKAPDTERTPTVDIPMKDVLAIAMEKAGIVGPALEKMLVDAMTEALNNKKTSSQAIQDRMKDIDKAQKQVVDLLGQRPKKPVSGRTTYDVEVVELIATTAPELGAVG